MMQNQLPWVRESAADLARRWRGVSWSGFYPAGHPVWGLVALLEHPPEGMDWRERVSVWRDAGWPVDGDIGPSPQAWRRARSAQIRVWRIGTSDCGGPDVAPSATALARAQQLGRAAAVGALEEAGASPWTVSRCQQMAAHAWSWDRVMEEGGRNRWPEGSATLNWLFQNGHRLPPDSPVWDALPEWSETWQEAVLACWAQHRSAPLWSAWWAARPDVLDRWSPERRNVWPSLLAVNRSPALMRLLADPSRAVHGSPPQQVYADVTDPAPPWTLRLPPRQRLMHAAGTHHGWMLAPEGEALLSPWPWWTAQGGHPVTEGELSVLLGSSCVPASFWDAHPQTWAPHAETGRTPLFHATDAETASFWWARGCTLDALDADGNQAFALLLSRALRQRRPDLLQWVKDRWRAGEAPVVGSALGRPISDWVAWNRGAETAWRAACRRQGHVPPGVSETTRLALRARALNDSGVKRGLRALGGCSESERSSALAAAAAAAVSARPGSGRAQQTQVDILDDLREAGAPYCVNGTALLDVFLGHHRSSRGPLPELLVRLLDWHTDAQAPWTAARVVGTLASLDTHVASPFRTPFHDPESITPLPLEWAVGETARQWLTLLLGREPGEPVGLVDERLKHLEQCWDELQRECGGFPDEALVAFWEAALPADPEDIVRRWNLLMERPSFRAWVGAARLRRVDSATRNARRRL